MYLVALCRTRSRIRRAIGHGSFSSYVTPGRGAARYGGRARACQCACARVPVARASPAGALDQVDLADVAGTGTQAVDAVGGVRAVINCEADPTAILRRPSAYERGSCHVGTW